MRYVLPNSSDYTKEGLICGVIGGLGKYMLQIHQPFLINLGQAAFTALLCGAAGVAGKELYLYIKRSMKKKRNEKTV